MGTPVRLNKPLVDDREYRVVHLDNGLEALLIHDPTTDKAAAALEVGVGSYMDPDALPGLAHFLEHLLFMGTQKFPSENEYQQYVSEHAGMTNAYTASEATNYHFDVSWPHLRGALDRFAQFFIAPLFSESCTKREMLAVDSENKKNLQSDVWRLFQLEQTVSNLEHPMHKFSTGNLETLGAAPEEAGIDVRQRLIDFYRQYYTAGIMKLVVIGRDSLDTLEAWTREFFAAIPNPHPELASVQWPYASVPPLTAEHLGLIIRAKPVMDLNMLTITFPVPNQQPSHETQPFRYYVQLIGHESEGSLLHYLKERHWATELACHGQHIDAGTDYLLVSIELTNEGQAHWFDVIEALFSYIDMVKAAGPQEWVHRELMSLTKSAFLYRQKAKAMPVAVSLATVMHRPIPRERLLDFSVVQRFDPAEVREFGKHLTRENMRVLLVGQSLDGLDQREKWYGTEHSVKTLPEIKAVDLPQLHLPKPNEFLPNSFDLTREESDAAPRKQTRPRLLINTPELKLWHKLDDTFFQPKASFYLKLANPMVSATIEDYMKADMFIALLNDDLADYTYYADTAGMNHSLSGIQDGIEIAVNGFSEKLAKLLSVLAEKVSNASLRADRFNVVKEQQLRQLSNLAYAMPFAQRALQSTFLFAENVFKYEHRVATLETLTFEGVAQFVAELRDQGFGVELLTLGNVNSRDAQQIAASIRSIVPQSVKGPTTENRRAASYLLPPGRETYYKRPLADKANTNNVVDLGFQFGHTIDSRLSVTQSIITQIIKEPAFDQLRTKEQLGYVVIAYKRQLRGTMWLKIGVQTEEPSVYAEGRILHFLHNIMRPQLEAMGEEEYRRNVDAVIAQQLEKPKNMNEETEQYWTAISSGYYDFNKRERAARLASEISKQEVLQAFDQYILNANTRAQFSLHLVAQSQPKALDAETSLMKAVHRLVTERDIPVTPEAVRAFREECRGLEPHEALGLLAAKLVAEYGKTREEAQDFVEVAARLAQEAGKHHEPTPQISGEEITDEKTFKKTLEIAPRAAPVVSLETLTKYEDGEAKL